MLDEYLRAQEEALQEIRQGMNLAEGIIDFIWRTVWPERYEAMHYVNVRIVGKFEGVPEPLSAESIAFARKILSDLKE